MARRIRGWKWDNKAKEQFINDELVRGTDGDVFVKSEADVRSTQDLIFNIDSDNDHTDSKFQVIKDSSTPIFTIRENGRVGIGTTAPDTLLDVNGTITANTLSLGDNEKALFGTGNDLEIYHDGSNSYIDDVGTGSLFLRSGTTYFQNAAGTKTSIQTNSGAGQTIYFDNSAKFATTATGVSITGNIVVSGTVDGRDVATDGTKLDGIETGATADQSAAEILTAIKTVDGASSGLDADILDGQEGSYYLDWTNTTNKPDPVITLNGDASGSVTLTDLASGTLTATLATVNSNVGSFGSATAIPVVTVNAKGLVTAVSTASISTDLGTAGDSGTGTVALASQSLTISGTSNEIETSASNQSITIGLPNTVAITTGLTVGGNSVLTTANEGSGNGIDADTVDGIEAAAITQSGDSVALTGDVTGSTTVAADGTISVATTIAANSVALGTDTTGNYVATVSGTANEIEVSGSGSETAAVTVGLPSDVTIGNELTVTTSLFTPIIDTTDSSAITVTPPANFSADVTMQNSLTVDNDVNVGSHVDFNNNHYNRHAEYQEGRMWYDKEHATINYWSDDPNVVHEIGLEEHQRVYNDTGSTILKGQPLYFSGNYTSGAKPAVPTVGLADATDVNAYNAQGIAAGDIPNNSYGYCLIAGQLFDVDTSGLSAGQNFFVGLTPGAVQNASPVYPNYPMCLGWVVKSDPTNGILLVNQQNHSVNSFRVRTSAHIGTDLQVDGDLTVLGSTTSVSTSDVTAGAPFYRANEGDSIGEAGTTFSGSGLDDAFFSGHFTGTSSTTYYVKIDSVGTPDTFAVSLDDFSTTISTGTAITGDKQLIHSADNIYVEFGATTGHTLNDKWTGTAAPTNVDTGFFSNRNTGGSGVGYTHVGLFFDVTDQKWKLVEEYDPTPAGTIDTSHASYNEGTLVAGAFEAPTGTFSSTLTLGGNNVLTTANEGSGNGIDADTVDGVEASSFLRSDAADVKTSGDLRFDDSIKAVFGTGNDLSIYHDGSHSYITDVGTGNLWIGSNGAYTALGNSTASEFYIKASNNGAVELYYDNSAKIATTNTGVDVTGNIVVSGTVDGRDVAADGTKLDGIEAGATADQTQSEINALGITATGLSGTPDITVGTVSSGNITLTSTDDGSAAGPDLILYRNSASPADADYIGQIQFKGRNDGNADEIYAKVTGKIDDASNATEDGIIETAIKGNGSFVIVSRQRSDELQLLNGVGLNVDGNIVVNGTVDGRDVAADGTKLDGIEANATADQTASEILTAIKTVDGTGSGLDADLLDGQHGSYYQNAGNLNAGTLPAARLTEALGTYQIDPLISTNQGLYSSLNVPTMSMAAIVDPAIENKMQFQVPSSVEVSTDNGSTWSALSVSSNDLKDLVSGTGTGGGITISNQSYTQLRLTWNYSDYNYGYVFLNYLHYYTSPKRNTIAPTIEARDYTNQTFSTIESDSAHGGWPTHIWMPHNSIAFYNSAGRNDVVRITWDLTWDTGNSDSIQITKLNWYGTYPVASHNRVSSWDRDGNMSVTNGLSVTDSITVGGTVDGRDVAADGTKLDGIESGATADQTASEILTAIKTVDGSGSGLDADLLDGQQATKFVRDAGNGPTDLDDAGMGVWRINTGHTNQPGGSATNYSTLVSFDNVADTGFQVAVDYNSASMYFRGGNGSVYGGSGSFQSWAKVWNDLNDGSGSGLDADTVDGIEGASFLRSDAADTATGNLTFDGTVTIDQQIIHKGDTNTYIEYHAEDSFRVVTGGTERLEVTNSGVRLSDAFTLPTSDGSANQVLTTNGSGTVTWADGGGGSARTEAFPTVTNGSANVTMAASYTLSQIDVYLNGARMKGGTDYSVSGTTLTFSENLTTGDVVALYAYDTAENLITGNWSDLNDVSVTGAATNTMVRFDGSNYVAASTTEDSSGNLSVSGNATTTGNVGIGTTSPSKKLHVYRNDTNTDAQVLIEQEGTGDASIGFLRTGVYNWMTGIDTTDNKYKISGSGAGLDTNNYFAIDTSGNTTLAGDLTVTGGQVIMPAVSTRDKYRVWNSSTYTIGMDNAISFGGLNDYAMTFQFSNTDARGFWFGDSAHTDAQGAMALTTNGKLTVAHSARIGYGETDTTTPGATHALDVNGSIADSVGDVRIPRVTNITGNTTIANEGVYYVTNNPTVTMGAPAAGTIMTLYNSSASSMTLARGSTVVWFRKGADNDTVSHTSITLGAYSTATITFFSATFAVVTGTDVT